MTGAENFRGDHLIFRRTKGGEQSNPMVIRPDCVDQAEKLLRTLRLLSETSTVTSRTMFVTAFQVSVIIYRLGVATGGF